MKRTLALLTVSLLAVPVRVLPAVAEGPEPVRFATFNASLNRSLAGQLISHLSAPGNAQADTVAEIIQRVRPDVLLINEFDFDDQGPGGSSLAAALFQQNYLSAPHGDADPITYPFRFVAPSNTGIPSGFDLNNNGVVGGPDDALGFGFFPGQFGMAVYSRFPVGTQAVRTFQTFLWKDMPGALLPDDPNTPAPADWYSPAEPAVFDGPEDRNGTRNHDEIRFWADYVMPGRSGYIYDDQGERGGLAPGSLFVIAGDENSDPFDGDSIPGSAQLLLEHPLINTRVTPDSEGAVEQAALQGGANATHLGDPAFDTADFADVPGPGNLRADYVLPRKNMPIEDAAVFWPTSDDPLFRLVGTFPFPSSDHRLVWIDVRVPSA